MHATRVVTLSAGDLGTTSKNNLRGITLGMKSVWWTLYPLLVDTTERTTLKRTKADDKWVKNFRAEYFETHLF